MMDRRRHVWMTEANRAKIMIPNANTAGIIIPQNARYDDPTISVTSTKDTCKTRENAEVNYCPKVNSYHDKHEDYMYEQICPCVSGS